MVGLAAGCFGWLTQFNVDVHVDACQRIVQSFS